MFLRHGGCTVFVGEYNIRFHQAEMFRPCVRADFLVAKDGWHIATVRAAIAARLVAKTARWRHPPPQFSFFLLATPLVLLPAAARTRRITSNLVHAVLFLTSRM